MQDAGVSVIKLNAISQPFGIELEDADQAAVHAGTGSSAGGFVPGR